MDNKGQYRTRTYLAPIIKYLLKRRNVFVGTLPY